jgi:hypothetical protein
MGRILILCLVLMILTTGIVSCGPIPATTPTAAPRPTATPEPTLAPSFYDCHIVYKLHGTAKDAYVSILSPSMSFHIPGREEWEPSLVTVPWEHAVTYGYCGPDTRLFVDFNSGSPGSLTCEIWVNGELKDSETSSAGRMYCDWSPP